MSILDLAPDPRLPMILEAGIYPYFPVFTGHERGVATLDGREIVMCGSNGYLGLASDPRVIAAAAAAVNQYGTSVSGSRLLNGTLDLHEMLEAELADYFGYPAALVYPTGYQANVGLLSTVLKPGGDRPKIALLDGSAHASLIDGVRMSGAGRSSVRTFDHNDFDHLEARLSSLSDSADVLVIVDGVDSMEGDIAPLPELLEVCRRHGAELLVDDAHGAGVLAGGRGTAAHHGLQDGEVPVATLTFSKAFASIGGAVLGSAQLIQALRHASRALMFSAACSPPNTAAALAALRIVREEPEHAAAVLGLADQARTGLRALGYTVGGEGTPIVPVHLGDDLSVFLAHQELLKRGVYVNPVVAPAGTPRLRTSYIATQTPEHIATMLEAFAQLRDCGLDLRPSELVRKALGGGWGAAAAAGPAAA